MPFPTARTVLSRLPAIRRQGDGFVAVQGYTSVRKATVFTAQGDTFAGKATVFRCKATLFAAHRPQPCHRRQHPPLLRLVAAALALLALAAPLAAKDSLGVFGQWGAFRDPAVPRCYAIVAAEPPQRREGAREQAPFASVGTWPRRGVRGQVHLRLSRSVAQGAAISLRLGGRYFALTGAGSDAWARDARMDAAIVAALRSSPSMSVFSRDRTGSRFTDRYSLDGAATAMDAATVGCARIR